MSDPELQICPWSRLPAKECPSFEGDVQPQHLVWHLNVLEQAGILEHRGGKYRLTPYGREVVRGKQKP